MIEECKTCKFLSVNSDPILETQYWVVVLEPNQGYLGQCFVNLKQHKGDLAELSEPEWLDFLTVVKELEVAIGAAFNPDLYNWTCLMNNAFRSSPAKPHVHWSVVPRYSKSVSFSGMEFADPQFAHHYDTQHSLEVSDDVRQAIKAEIKKHLK